MVAVSKRICAAAVSIALGCAVGAPVAAQKMTNEGMVPDGPISELARMNEPRDEFHLYGSRDVELVRFRTGHLLSICVARADPGQAGAATHAYPLKAVFDGDTAVIEPGNCLSFEAMRVKVSPAAPIPQGVELSGTVRVIR